MMPRVQASIVGGALRTCAGDAISTLAAATAAQRFGTMPAPAPWHAYPAAAQGVGTIVTGPVQVSVVAAGKKKIV